MAKKRHTRPPPRSFPKCPTGIQGLDEITGGGLPRGRPTLVCGGPGCGKSLLSIEFLVRGAVQHGEPGVLISFEETEPEISANVRSLGFDLDALSRRKLLSVDYVRVERSEIEETGEYDLEGLFVRLGFAIDSIGAKRVVLDTIESLFAGLSNAAILRAELRRLFRWLKDRGVTCIVTGERGEQTLTRQGLEEYVSDCVILLDHRVEEQISTRRLRVVKYRGSSHGTNEYPFLIDEDGVSVMPITSMGLTHSASTERVSSGIPRLDSMLGGRGFYRGSSILVSGTAGTGKSSIAAHFAESVCRGRKKCLVFAFEESQDQIIRNMHSIGIQLEDHVRGGLLRFWNVRPTAMGLETHLASMHKRIAEFRPAAVVVDPISNLMSAGDRSAAGVMLTRLVDYLKLEQITALFTSLTHGGTALERTETDVSSIMDTWILLRDIEIGGERNRGLYVLKSRGMAHSNQIREFRITSQGIELLDVYLGPEGVLTGSARVAQEAREAAARAIAREEINRKQRSLECRRRALEGRIVALQAKLQEEQDELERSIAFAEGREQQVLADRANMADRRLADNASRTAKPNGNKRQRARR